MVTIKRRQNNLVFQAIADPTRREILCLLRRSPRRVGEIAANFSTSRPAISKHLRLLRAAGLVVSRQDGTARICNLNAKPLRAVNGWLQDYEAFWGESMGSLKRYIEGAKPEVTRRAPRPTKEGGTRQRKESNCDE
jgi:DNA-binding transcriptional ArsR family regulator